MTDPIPSKAPESSREPSSTNAPDANKPADDAPPAVRFSSAIEEISPSVTAQQHSSSDKPGPSPLHNELGSGDNDNLQVASKSLHGTGLQERRMNTYHFEAFSLPPSRVSRPQFIPPVHGRAAEQRIRGRVGARLHVQPPCRCPEPCIAHCISYFHCTSRADMLVFSSHRRYLLVKMNRPTLLAYTLPAPLASIPPMAVPESPHWLRRPSRPPARVPQTRSRGTSGSLARRAVNHKSRLSLRLRTSHPGLPSAGR